MFADTFLVQISKHYKKKATTKYYQFLQHQLKNIFIAFDGSISKVTKNGWENKMDPTEPGR